MLSKNDPKDNTTERSWSKDLKSQKLVNNKQTSIERYNLVRRINSTRKITVDSRTMISKDSQLKDPYLSNTDLERFTMKDPYLSSQILIFRTIDLERFTNTKDPNLSDTSLSKRFLCRRICFRLRRMGRRMIIFRAFLDRKMVFRCRKISFERF